MKVILMMATTADGFIARNSQQSSMDWTSGADKKLFREKTKNAGVLIMGSNTYKTIGKPLPDRLNVVMTRNPDDYESIPGKLEFVSQSPKDILKDLESRSFEEVVLCGGSQINYLFLSQRLVSELWVTIEPQLFGAGLNLSSESLNNINLKLIDCEGLGESSVLLKYQLSYQV